MTSSSRNIPRQELGQEPRVPRQVAADGRIFRRVVAHLFGRFRPLERQMDYAAWSPDRFQRGQRRPQDRCLAGRVAGLAQGAAQRVLDGRNARRRHGGGQVGHGREGDGGKAGGFDFTLQQSNGPTADRSGGNQDHDVRVILLQVPDQRRRGLGQELLRPQDVAHDRVMPCRRTADLAGRGQLLQPLKREQAVEILFGATRINMQVVEPDVLAGRGVWQDAVGWVAPPRVAPLPLLVEGPVRFERDAGRTDQADRAFA